MLIYSGIAAAILALIHLFANKMGFSHIPRSKWLSAAGGVSVAYVFIHLLPELEEWQSKFEESHEGSFSFMSNHLYLISLFGLTVFYGLERAAKLSSESERKNKDEKEQELPQIFWIHILSFAIYNAIIGHLLVSRDSGSGTELVWFVVAMAFHFMVNDYGLLDHYRHNYLKKGRWIAAFAVLGGWALGAFTNFSETAIAILFAFISGSVILNVLKEELPEERKSNFWAFFTGIVLYSAILLIA